MVSLAVPYQPRLLDASISRLFSQLPALFIVGPRATGKTTTAARHTATVVRLDRDAEAAAFRADPDATLARLPEPVLLDEWQVVPATLGAVKRAVDARPTPGRFIVTGSVRAELDGELWPGTGRVVRVPMFGLTVREQFGDVTAPTFIDRVVAGLDLLPASDSPSLTGYLELALRGGFPEPALRLGDEAREHWLTSYVDHLLTRDATQVDVQRDPVRLRRYLEACAANTAGVVDELSLMEAAGINRRTAQAYDRVLGNLLVTDAIPAWTSNRLKRLVMRPKRYLIDSSLVGAVLRVDVRAVLRDGDLLGRLLDTFVAAQLRSELATSHPKARLYHVRQQQGRFELDLLIDLGGGAVIGIEIKASAAPTADDARHLAGLRDRLGDLFVAGVVLHTGPRTFPLGDRIVAAPISTLWANS